MTGKLAAPHFYQLALPAVKPRPGIDFDPDAAQSGDELFSGKASCNSCHREPLWTELGWNQHTPDEMKIDGFEADRAPASINALTGIEQRAVPGFGGTPEELDTLLAEGLASKQLMEDEFWNSVSKQTDALLAEHKTGPRL